MDHQVSDQVKHIRSTKLLALNEKNSANYLQAHIGSDMEVLMEEEMTFEGETYFVGHTKEYIKVAVKTEENLTNQFVTVKAVKILKEMILLGEQ